MLPGMRNRFQAPVFMKGMVYSSAKLAIFRQLKMVINVYDPALSVNISADEAGQVRGAPVHSGDEQSSGDTRESFLMQWEDAHDFALAVRDITACWM